MLGVTVDAPSSEAFSESTVLCLPTLPRVGRHIRSLRLCLCCHLVSTGEELLLFWPSAYPRRSGITHVVAVQY